MFPKAKPRRTPLTSTTTTASHHTSRPQAASLSEDQKAEIKEAFELFDSDKDGAIDYHELKVAMRALGFEMRKVEVVDLLKRYGNEGLMEFDAFQKISTSTSLIGISIIFQARALLLILSRSSDREDIRTRSNGRLAQGLRTIRRRSHGENIAEEPTACGKGIRRVIRGRRAVSPCFG